MFRALGARLTLDWKGVGAADMLSAAAEKTWVFATDGLKTDTTTWQEGELTELAVTVRTLHAAAEDRELYRTVVHRPDQWDPSMLWLTTVDLVRRGDTVEAGISVEQDMRHHRVPPSPLLPPLTGLLHQLVERGAIAGSQRVRAVPQAVVGADQVEYLVNRVLLAPDRRLPVVLFTSIKETDGSYPSEAGDPTLAARELCGLAHVFIMPRAEDTHRLTRRLQMLSAYDGAVRIYWPRFRLTDPPPRHPLHLRQRLNTSSGPAIIRRVVEAGARSYRPPDGTATLLAARRRQHEHERIAAFLASEPDPARRVTALRDELFHAIDANAELEHEMDSMRDQLIRAVSRADDLETQLAATAPTGAEAASVDLAGRGHSTAASETLQTGATETTQG